MNPGNHPDLAAREAALLDRVDGEPPESWNPREHPEQPRVVAGEILERRVKPGRGFEGADAETVLLRTSEGKDWLLWLFAKVLLQEFAGLAAGDVVAVKYEGHVDGGKGGKGYEHFRVVVDQAGGRSPINAGAYTDPPKHEQVEAPDYPAVDERTREPEPPLVSEQLVTCEACGFRDPHHATGCPNDIPF